MATRGPEVRRFAWGNQQPSCDQHWRISLNPAIPGACCGNECEKPELWRVGQHTSGAGPYGVEDVLATHAELIGPSPRAALANCRGPGGCAATGMEPGAIDFLIALEGSSSGHGPSADYAAGFRCGWDEEGVR
jgi:hypothetical protein